MSPKALTSESEASMMQLCVQDCRPPVQCKMVTHFQFSFFFFFLVSHCKDP